MGKLIIPSCSGLLDSFNTRLTHYKEESICCLQGKPDPLLLALFSYIYQTKATADPPWTFKVAAFKSFLGYTSGGKSRDLLTRLRNLQRIGYTWNFRTYPEVLNISFNGTRTVATVESRYFQRIFHQMESFSTKRDGWGRPLEKGRSTYSSLVDVGILKERSIPAVEIVIEMVKLIERRGPLLDGGTAHISTSTLVDRCPTLYRRVQGLPTKERNRILRSALIKSLELMREKTSVYDTFINLDINLPTKISISKDCKILIKYCERIY